MASRISQQLLANIGPYEVVELLGAGGMSRIYKARHPSSGEIVAIKVPQERLIENAVFLKRFEQEFSIARLLEHPHFVRVLQFGYDESKPYIVMEFVEGRSLGARIQQDGAVPEAESVRIITQVASALHAAHQRKIIHRDVKPDNVLLATSGQAKLTDLGLAKDVEADHNLTRPLRGMGTPNYIAPEQFNDAKHADARCDVYALAATLYTAVTGQPPFQARGNLSILKKKLRNDLIPPRCLAPDLSEPVERTICQALSADPNARPATCRQFIHELRGRSLPPVRPATPVARRPVADRRVSVRYLSQVKGACRPLTAEKKWRWTATIRDISTGGIALLVNRRFEPGTVLRLKLPGSSSRRLFLARVIHVQPHSSRTWLVGCVFPRPLSEEEMESLL